MLIEPAPPGVLIPQFNFGSIATRGLSPVPIGVSVPPTVATSVGTPVEKSRTTAVLVVCSATNPRCVSGVIPSAYGTGCGFGGVLGFGRFNVVTANVVRSIAETELSTLLV